MTNNLILLDPHPRPLDLIFSCADRARLERLGQVIWHDGAPASDEYIEKYLPQTLAIIGQTALPKERLDRAPHLKFVANVESNFLPNVDYAECYRRGIAVVATSPVFAHAVAEMALGLAISAARRLPGGDAAIRSGTEVLYGEGSGSDTNSDAFLLRGKTLGLVGCGNLGRALLPLLRPFSHEVLVHDPWIHPQVLRELDVEPVELDALFGRCRVVFILSATTTENQGGLGAKHFNAMERGSVVVLSSRAGVVNFPELLDAANRGQIRAAIDVFPEEPIPTNDPVRTSQNTVLSAHRAGNVPEIWPDMGRMVVDDLECVLRGLPPQQCQRATLETVSRLRSKPVG